MHLCSYYHGSSVYARLFESLDSLVDRQCVYVPVRASVRVATSKSCQNGPVVVTRKIIKPAYRFFYRYKIRVFVKNFLSAYRPLDVDAIDCFHAHTLFTDGGLAYELHKLTGKPYIVAVRNTDVNLFLKYALHLRLYVKKIVGSAQKVVFISPSMETIFFKYLNRTEVDNTCVIPNGVDDFWFSNGEGCRDRAADDVPNILFVGNIDSNKNPLLLLDSFEQVQISYPGAKIRIVGPAGNQFEKVCKKSFINDGVTIIEKVDTKEKLIEFYQWANVLAMVSHRETFGLVYVEALSQGVPLVYSRGQGFDGFFSEGEVGFSCDSRSASDISSAILNVFEHGYLQKDLTAAATSFTWSSISEKYFDLYKEMAV